MARASFANAMQATTFRTRAADFARERWLSADPRWLGIFRVLLGVLLSVDLLRRWADARAFYANDGLLPNHYSLFRPMGRVAFSFYHPFSTLGEISVAFALTLGAYLCFTIGLKARLFHFISAICVTSLNARNVFVENGGTVVVNLLTVITLFLPLGRRFSIDAVLASLRARRESSPAELNDRSEPALQTAPVVSLAVLLILIEWSAIYFFNTVHKNGIGWRNGSALHWFFEQDRIVTFAAIWMRERTPLWLIQGMTWGTLVIEGGLALLYLNPFWKTWSRRVILILVWTLHGMIALFARLGPFSYVMSLVPVLLLGARDFELLARWFGRARRQRVVVLDGSSALYLSLCRVLQRLDPFARLTFVDARETGQLPSGIDASSVASGFAVVDPVTAAVTIDERALAEALTALPFGFVLALPMRLPGLAWVSARLWRRLAERRIEIAGWLGLDRPPARAAKPAPLLAELRASSLPTLRELGVGLLGFAIVGQMLIDNRFIASRLHVQRTPWMATIIDYPRLFQGWTMFAPEPPYEDGRVVIDGRTADGRKLDPFTGAEPDFDPYTRSGWGHDQLWCDYHNRIRFPGHAANREHLKSYLLNLHRFTGRTEDQLVAFDVWWVQDRSPAPGQQRGEPLPPQKLLSHGSVRDSGAAPAGPRTARSH